MFIDVRDIRLLQAEQQRQWATLSFYNVMSQKKANPKRHPENGHQCVGNV